MRGGVGDGEIVLIHDFIEPSLTILDSKEWREVL